MVPHILLADSTLIIQTPNGPITRTPYQINYYKILDLVKSGTLNGIYPLLPEPDYPNGKFLIAFYDNCLIIHHIPNNTQIIRSCIENRCSSYEINSCVRVITGAPNNPKDIKGIFTSIDEIKEIYPEYFV